LLNQGSAQIVQCNLHGPEDAVGAITATNPSHLVMTAGLYQGAATIYFQAYNVPRASGMVSVQVYLADHSDNTG
jgi:hypothetical protein